MALHRCITAECPFVGQVTNRGCKCHQTDEQVLRVTIADLMEALRDIAEHPGQNADEAAHWRADLARAAISKAKGE